MWPKSLSNIEDPVVPLELVTHLPDYCGKDNLRSSIGTRMEKSTQLECLDIIP